MKKGEKEKEPVRLSGLGKLVLRGAIKTIVRPLFGNRAFLVSVFVWLAKILVARTDNKLDDRILKALENEFGVVDTSFLDDAL